MKIHVTQTSTNKKTGPMPVTTTSRDTCPTTCPWYDKGCYALGGPLRLHWDKVSKGERGKDWADFLLWAKGLANGQPWRHNQAGDLPGDAKKLDKVKTKQLMRAAAHTKGFTYTHKWKGNEAFIAQCNAIGGFTINASCDSLEEAKRAYEAGIPTTVMLPENYKESSLPIKPCPAEYLPGKNCGNCMLCEKKDRKVIVGFTPHGNAAKTIKEKING